MSMVYGKQLQLAAFQVFSETSQVSSRLAYESIHKRFLAINDAVCVYVRACACGCVCMCNGKGLGIAENTASKPNNNKPNTSFKVYRSVLFPLRSQAQWQKRVKRCLERPLESLQTVTCKVKQHAGIAGIFSLALS